MWTRRVSVEIRAVERTGCGVQILEAPEEWYRLFMTMQDKEAG
jgi:hypothetical protein